MDTQGHEPMGRLEMKEITDIQRMDWLMQKHVEVRISLLFGSRPLFHSSPEKEEGEYTASDLRKQIDQGIRNER